ncbi:MAG TPA: hypothetical protein VGN79_05475 [Devosia sp.]|nr:hypothetical protein [Devosia sp.]
MAFKMSRALMAGTMLAVLTPAPIVLAQSDSTNSNMQQSGDSTTWQNPDRIAEIQDESERIRAFSVLIGQSVYDEMLSAQAAQSSTGDSDNQESGEATSGGSDNQSSEASSSDADTGGTDTDAADEAMTSDSDTSETTAEDSSAADTSSEGSASTSGADMAAAAEGEDATASNGTGTGESSGTAEMTGTEDASDTDSATSSQDGSAMAGAAGLPGVTAVNVVDITQLLTPADVLALELLAEQNNVQVSQLQDFIELDEQLRTQLEDANFLPADVVAVQQSADGVIDLFVIPGWLNR